jgi:hypothetical protein
MDKIQMTEEQARDLLLNTVFDCDSVLSNDEINTIIISWEIKGYIKKSNLEIAKKDFLSKSWCVIVNNDRNPYIEDVQGTIMFINSAIKYKNELEKEVERLKNIT